MTQNTHLEAYIDGSAAGNPGPAGAGVLIRDAEGNVLLEDGFNLGEMTNNAAEYNALLIALEEALLLKAESVKVCSDSELLVRQMNGQYKVKNEGLQVLHQHARRLCRAFKKCVIEYVPRERNQVADKLARQAGKDPSRKHFSTGRNRSGELFN